MSKALTYLFGANEAAEDLLLTNDFTGRGFPPIFEKRQVIYARKIGSCSHIYIATGPPYVAMNACYQFRTVTQLPLHPFILLDNTSPT